MKGEGLQYVVIAALALVWWLASGKETKADDRNPGGQATDAELAYTDYLTNRTAPGYPLTWEEWLASGKPQR